MARVALPASKIRARRRRRRIFLGLVVLVVLVVLVGGFVWLSHAPFLRIEQVAVLGARTAATSSIEALVRKEIAGSYWSVFAKNNILLYPQKDLVAALAAKYPQFKVVAVQAENFHTLGVEVVEREAKALWCEGPPAGGCYLMDEDGVVYALAPTFSAPVYVAYRGRATEGKLPRQYLTKEQFHALSALVGALAQKESAERLESVVVDAAGDVRATFASGFAILFPLGVEGGDIFERYTLARESESFVGRPLNHFEYLDLRFGDKLYYKTRD